MKLHLWIYLLLCLSQVLTAQTARVEWTEPANSSARGQLRISASGDIDLKSKDLPVLPGLIWGDISSHSSMTIINGRQSNSAMLSVAFQCTEPGTISIPAIPYTINGAAASTQPRTMTIARSPLDEGLLMTMLQGPPARVWAGQRFDIIFKVELGSKLRYLDIPQYSVDVSGLGISTFDQRSNGMHNIKELRCIETEKGNCDFITLECTALMSGSYAGEIKMQAACSRSPRLPGRDNVMYAYKTLPLKVEVEALPPVPAGVRFTGLIGTYALSFSSSHESLACGQPLTLTLEAKGEGNTQRFDASAWAPLGFRHLATEYKAELNPLRITYVITPESPDSTLGRLSFATFNPLSGLYQIASFNPRFTATGKALDQQKPGIDSSGTASQVAITPPMSMAALAATAPLPPVLPATSFGSVLSLILLGATLLLLLGCCLLWPLGPRQIRRRQARQLLRQLDQCPPEQRLELIRTQILPWLRLQMQAPGSATPEDLAQSLHQSHPELQALLLRELPALYAGPPAKPEPATWERLIRHLAAALFLLCLPHVSAAPVAQAPADPVAQAAELNAKAEYLQALELLLAQQKPGPIAHDARLAHATGLTLANLQRHREAAAWLAAAAALNPDDPRIVQDFTEVAERAKSPELFALLRPPPPASWLRLIAPPLLILGMIVCLTATLLLLRRGRALPWIGAFAVMASALSPLLLSQPRPAATAIPLTAKAMMLEAPHAAAKDLGPWDTDHKILVDPLSVDPVYLRSTTGAYIARSELILLP